MKTKLSDKLATYEYIVVPGLNNSEIKEYAR